MEQKKEQHPDIVISGEDAGYLRDLFCIQTDDISFSKTLDELFGSALFGQSRNGGREGISPNSVFEEFHWHYARIIDMKKLAAIVCEAVARTK